MASPKMSETGSRIIGSNLMNNCKLRQKQMKYLLENMTSPDFSFLDEEIKDSDDLNKAGITYRILNSQGFGKAEHSSNAQPSWNSVAYFMANIQDYLPVSLRSKQNPRRLWRVNSFYQNDTQVIAAETQELLDDMCDWLVMMKTKIEDVISSKYFNGGRLNHLEVLKRRFKDEWSEKVEQSVDANVNTDTQLNVIIEDA